MDFEAIVTRGTADRLMYGDLTPKGMHFPLYQQDDNRDKVVPSIFLTCGSDRFHEILQQVQGTTEKAMVNCSRVRDVLVLAVLEDTPVHNAFAEADTHLYIDAWHKE